MTHSMTGMDGGDTPRALDVLRESQDRALHREGIPMFAVLGDERPARKAPHSGGISGPAAVAGEAERAAAILARTEHYRHALAPTRREDDMGVVISILAVAAYEDFDRSVAG